LRLNKNDVNALLTSRVVMSVAFLGAADRVAKPLKGIFYLSASECVQVKNTARLLARNAGVESDDDQEILMLRLRELGYDPKTVNGYDVSLLADISVSVDGTLSEYCFEVIFNPMMLCEFVNKGGISAVPLTTMAPTA
jgi:hypothetical protein